MEGTETTAPALKADVALFLSRFRGKFGKQVEVDVSKCLEKPCAHHVTIAGLSSSPGDDKQQQQQRREEIHDLGFMSCRSVIEVISSLGVHNKNKPHDMWAHLQHSLKEDSVKAKPKRRYNKTKTAESGEDSGWVTVKRPKTEGKTAKSTAALPSRKSESRMMPRRLNTKNRRKCKSSTEARHLLEEEQQQQPFRAPVERKASTDLSIENVVGKGCLIGRPQRDHSRWNFFAQDKRTFPAEIIHILSPRSTATQCDTGEFGAPGCKTTESSIVAANLLAHSYALITGRHSILSNFSPVNFTTSGDLGYPIDPVRMTAYLNTINPPQLDAHYDVATIRMIQLKYYKLRADGLVNRQDTYWACNIFPTGKICVVGFETPDDITDFMMNHLPLLVQWAKENAPKQKK